MEIFDTCETQPSESPDLTSGRWRRIEAILAEALDRTDAGRRAFVDLACDDDSALRHEVEGLLRADGDEEALALEKGLFAGPGIDPPADPRIGRRVGPYRLQRLLGRGGMSDVYLAERENAPFRRPVAVKLIRPELGGPEVWARFRQEQQILARLVHPHIVSLLDGGVTEDGRPYLVMHRVEGRALTEDCDARRLGLEPRIALFRQVCSAVQFAHRNLVVHRDLKPGNILVTEDGEIRLLDFGIAKLLDPSHGGAPATRTRFRPMTPEYAAPEQVLGGPITTATDVHGLGLLLYELLTGRRAFELEGRTASEMERVICEQPPTRPSRAIESSDPLGIGEARSAHPRHLQRQLEGDLDLIVLKALHKCPERRYPSAEALGEDLERFLEGRPIAARSDSLTYRTSKFVRRHRLGVAAGGALLTLLLVAGTLTTVQATRIAEHARALEAERDRTLREAEKAARVKTLVGDLFKAMDPEAAGSPISRLETAATRMIDDLDSRPDLQVEIMDEVVTLYLNLGLYPAAQETAERALAARRALGGEDPALAPGRVRLGEALYHNSHFSEAEHQFLAALDELRDRPAADPETRADALLALSQLYRFERRYAEAEAAAAEAHDLYRSIFGELQRKTIRAAYQLAFVRGFLWPAADADAALRDVLHRQKKLLGPDHPDVAWTLVTLGSRATRRGELEEAETLLREALALHQARYHDDHPDLSRSLMALARLEEKRGRLDAAEAFLREVLQHRQERLGQAHAATISAKLYLGKILGRKGDLAEAETLLLDLLPAARSGLGAEHPVTIRALRGLDRLHEIRGRPDDSTSRPEISARGPRADAAP